MVIMVLEKVPVGLRGELSRWLIEPHAGVFIGHTSALVRDKLWDKCVKAKRTGGIVQAWSTNTEQRFRIRTAGDTQRNLIDMEGLQLITIPHDLDEIANGSVLRKRLKHLAKDSTSVD